MCAIYVNKTYELWDISRIIDDNNSNLLCLICERCLQDYLYSIVYA